MGRQLREPDGIGTDFRRDRLGMTLVAANATIRTSGESYGALALQPKKQIKNCKTQSIVDVSVPIVGASRLGDFEAGLAILLQGHLRLLQRAYLLALCAF